MTIDRKLLSSLWLVACAGCALPPPPAPRDIDCAQIDRAEERFPEECGEEGTRDAEIVDLDAGSGSE
jgi:hypothetical protein